MLKISLVLVTISWSIGHCKIETFTPQISAVARMLLARRVVLFCAVFVFSAGMVGFFLKIFCLVQKKLLRRMKNNNVALYLRAIYSNTCT